jgi:hypothetical protein
MAQDRIGWKQCTTPFPGDFKVREMFDVLFVALGAPEGVALFSRTTADSKNTIFLLTPDAAKHSDTLPGKWTDAGDPSEHGWSLLVGGNDPHKRFGLRNSP